jgi:hypothetical protein
MAGSTCIDWPGTGDGKHCCGSAFFRSSIHTYETKLRHIICKTTCRTRTHTTGQKDSSNSGHGFMSMDSKFAAYFAASNKSFALTFPSILVAAAALWYLSDSLLWVVPAVIAAIEGLAKAHEIWARKRS